MAAPRIATAISNSIQSGFLSTTSTTTELTIIIIKAAIKFVVRLQCGRTFFSPDPCPEIGCPPMLFIFMPEKKCHREQVFIKYNYACPRHKLLIVFLENIHKFVINCIYIMTIRFTIINFYSPRIFIHKLIIIIE